MYKRDAQVESKESLDRMAQGIEHLIEVVSKDETLKAVQDLLKNVSLKDVKEIPKSDTRVDEIIRMPRVSGRAGTDGAAVLGGLGGVGGGAFGMNVGRVNTALRALEGNLGAFQRTILNTVGMHQRVNVLSEQAATLAASAKSVRATAYRPATDDEIAAVMQAASAKGLGGDLILKAASMLGKTGVPSSLQNPGGEKLLELVKSKDYGKVPTAAELRRADQMAASAARASTQAAEMETLVKVGTRVALITAPIVAGKLIHAGAVGQIEANRPLSMLSGDLATGYALYDVNRLMTNMKHAQGISKTMQGLLQSQSEFQKTLEPFKTFGTNVMNRFYDVGTTALDTVLKPFSWLANKLNQNNKLSTIVEEAAAYSLWGGIGGALIGGITGFFAGGPVGALAGAAGGAVKGAAIGGLVGAGVGTVKALTQDQVDKIKKEPWGGMVGVFAQEIVQTKICPPQRFIP